MMDSELDTVIWKKRAPAKSRGLGSRAVPSKRPRNASAHRRRGDELRKVEESDATEHARVGRELAMAIQRARVAKGWSQKELATAINERATIINEYESGRAIPNGAIINKLNRALGVSLPRPAGKKKKSRTKGAKGTATRRSVDALRREMGVKRVGAGAKRRSGKRPVRRW
eukprot:PLAT1208.1.p1 GENE.PLAT1208.1~~PLAT1208.1.p1  ORF type:complete len:183 (+),score=57.10 PLAT1208.1:38-550(+)